jgi:hypothetical protein
MTHPHGGTKVHRFNGCAPPEEWLDTAKKRILELLIRLLKIALKTAKLHELTVDKLFHE